MYNGLLHLHNVLRWVILILLLVSIFRAFTAKSSSPGLLKSSLFLLIAAHIQFLIGLYQYFAGEFGFRIFDKASMSVVMQNPALRFWAVEHITGMVIAIILITIARGKVKRSAYNAAAWLYVIALIALLVAVPWPFREAVARPWFPGS